MMTAMLIGVLLVGLLGGIHCASMCGGIIAALTPSRPIISIVAHSTMLQPSVSRRMQWYLILLFHLGRVSTYTLFGALAGGLASLPMLLNHVLPIQQFFLIVASLMLIGLGLALGKWLIVVQRVELLGRKIWQKISPLTQRFVPANTPKKSFIAGCVWGWLPCSMVYSVLMTALVQGSILRGALVMFVFGIGTLPNGMMLSMGSDFLKRMTQKNFLRKLAGVVVIVLGCLGLLRSFVLMLSPEMLLNHLPNWVVMCLPVLGH